MENILTQLPSHSVAILVGIFIAIICFNLGTDRRSNSIASFGLLISVILIMSGIFMYYSTIRN